MNLKPLHPTDDYYFQAVLNDYRMCFFESRTVGCLKKQYQRLKDLNLLKYQLIMQNNESISEEKKAARMFKLSFEQLENELLTKETAGKRSEKGSKSSMNLALLLIMDTIKAT